MERSVVQTLDISTLQGGELSLISRVEIFTVYSSVFSVSISHRKPLSSPSQKHKSLELFRKVKLNSPHIPRIVYNAGNQLYDHLVDCQYYYCLNVFKNNVSFVTCSGTRTNTSTYPTKLAALLAIFLIAHQLYLHPDPKQLCLLGTRKNSRLR